MDIMSQSVNQELIEFLDNSPTCFQAVENFRNRGYASLGGLILNRRNVPREEEKVQELAEDFHTQVVGTLSRSDLVLAAEEQGKTLLETYPESEMAGEYRTLAEQILNACREDGTC